MPRTFPAAAASAGLAALLVIGCSDNSSDTSSTIPDPAAADVEVEASRGSNPPTLTPQQSGTTNRLQAVSPVNSRVVWASGVGGTYVLTTDGGATWKAGVVPGAEALQFRDVEGVSEKVAYLLAAGVGTDSRIYKTEDGGATWTLQFQAEDPAAFYDCFAFWSRNRGLTFGDAINGIFPTLRTTNGRTWVNIGDRMPPAQAWRSGIRRERHVHRYPGGAERVDRHGRRAEGPGARHHQRRQELECLRYADRAGHAGIGRVQHRLSRFPARHAGGRRPRERGHHGEHRHLTRRREDLDARLTHAVPGCRLRFGLRG